LFRPEWDRAALDQLLGEIKTNDPALDRMLAELGSSMGQVRPGRTDPDAVPEPPDEPLTCPGDLWILGNHRLLCGDAGEAAEPRRRIGKPWRQRDCLDRRPTAATILPLAVDFQGQRIPSWDRQIDSLFQSPHATSDTRPRLDLLAQVLEPMIQRELLHRGVIGERRGYDAKLIGWVEVV
jgi:hypothetical protein